MSRLEMGSEFWLGEAFDKRQANANSDGTLYFLSGRTALDYIIRDIKAENGFDSIYMPSYCCESMIEPFVRNGVNICFYEVSSIQHGFRPIYDPYNHCDGVLLLDYFGYQSDNLPAIAERAKSVGQIVIYDATHKLNGHPSVETMVDYTFCSYRKWFYSNAAGVTKRGTFRIDAPTAMNARYEELRNQAAALKRDYITGISADKQAYLSLFSKAEDLLDQDYVGYAAEPMSVERLTGIDLEKVARKRRENAQHLIYKLQSLCYDWLIIPYQDIKPVDCPLFVPVLIDAKLRDSIRRQLIQQNIYCPVHWPLSKFHQNCGFHGPFKAIYQTELSLVCDQRYNLSDIDRMMETLKCIGETINDG